MGKKFLIGLALLLGLYYACNSDIVAARKPKLINPYGIETVKVIPEREAEFFYCKYSDKLYSLGERVFNIDCAVKENPLACVSRAVSKIKSKGHSLDADVALIEYETWKRHCPPKVRFEVEFYKVKR